MIRQSHIIYQRGLSGQGPMTTCISPFFILQKKKKKKKNTKKKKNQNVPLVTVVELLKEMTE